MDPVDGVVRDEYRDIVKSKDIHKVNQSLRTIMAKEGLGVALLVAWQHGLRIGHIPIHRDSVESADVQEIGADQTCPYRFVHVPVRQYRRNTDELVARKILDPNADPAMFVYHEDGLIGRFSFRNPESVGLDDDEIEGILTSLSAQGVIVPAHLENRQIQFKDISAKQRIQSSGKRIYVRVSHEPITRSNVRLPPGCEREEIWEYVTKAIEFRFACNYCSAQVLSPNEATLNSSYAVRRGDLDDLQTVRNYQLGFTFAPVGDPREVCHFLAWDFPHINDLVMNMEPQTYSFSDLIRLVRVIHQDIKRFADIYSARYTDNYVIAGGCNHWAGSSIYHQHYQFCRVNSLPILKKQDKLSDFEVRYGDVIVRRIGGWPVPAYVISSDVPDQDEAIMHVADQVAREWRYLSEGDDWTFGNEIAIKNHTQNIFVTIESDALCAVFVPRHRSKVSTTNPSNIAQKQNAGFLEMLGYMVIDDPRDFRRISNSSPEQRRQLGDSWLTELSPDSEAIAAFERNLEICLDIAVASYEQRIGDLTRPDGSSTSRAQAATIVQQIQNDSSLQSDQRELLYRQLLLSLLEAAPTNENDYLRETLR